MNYSQYGWLHHSCDQLAGVRTLPELAKKADRIIRSRPKWINDETFSKFESFVMDRAFVIKKRTSK